MNWKNLSDSAGLEELKKRSFQSSVLIFKHSTRCSISKMALDRLERSWKEDEMLNVVPYFLDLLVYRPVSNQIAEDFGVEHQSPQLLFIKDGKCVYYASHGDIDYKDVVNKHLLVV